MRSRAAALDALLDRLNLTQAVLVLCVVELLSNVQPLDPEMLAEWDAAGGVDYHLSTAQNAAKAMLDAMPGEDKAGFQTGFDGLPAGVQKSVFNELSLSPGGAVRVASEADLQRFASTEEGAELVTEWGSRAGRKIGDVRARMERMLDGMSPAEEEKALTWFDALPSPQAKAVLKTLAG